MGHRDSIRRACPGGLLAAYRLGRQQSGNPNSGLYRLGTGVIRFSSLECPGDVSLHLVSQRDFARGTLSRLTLRSRSWPSICYGWD